MDDKDKVDVTNTFVPYDHHTGRTRLLKALSALLARETENSELSGETTVTKTTPVVSWTQRMAGWFRRT